MNVELKTRIITFLGDLDDSQLTSEQQTEASALYGLLTRKPGRQPGFSPKDKVREEASRMLAESGPDGKELAS